MHLYRTSIAPASSPRSRTGRILPAPFSKRADGLPSSRHFFSDACIRQDRGGSISARSCTGFTPGPRDP
ncbi:MAG: hypothetical protein Q6365_011095 [Candidatus Sigynarchaeota archaeon]